MNKLVLFDIDGTLINSGEAGTRALNNSFQQVFSINNAFAGIRMAGKTDIQIIKECLAFHGLQSGDGILSSVLSEYLNSLRIEVNNNRKRLQPGVIDLLNSLKKMEGYWLGLLTGNIEEGARIKLGVFGLNKYFPIGAFGSDDEDRNSLLSIAVKKFEGMTNIDIKYEDCIVIGDTPLDVECAKPFGATAVVVSTGPYSYESLLETKADYVLRDLSYALDYVDELKGG
jgi:phosphoglycolate phosphatase-like HAD superfamily hydrolase